MLYGHGHTVEPLPMKKGRASIGRFVRRPVMAGVGVVGVERCSSLYRLLEGGQGRLGFAPVAHLLKDRQAAASTSSLERSPLAAGVSVASSRTLSAPRPTKIAPQTAIPTAMPT
jgi:hypothetical protein